MQKPDYNSPTSLKIFLEANGMAMQKKFGQNFLINSTARKKLIDELDIQNNTSVWEIGPGLGCMTDELLKRGAKVTAFEIDRGFCTCLRSFFEEYQKNQLFTLIEGDVLKTRRIESAKQKPDRVFGNLPYNIAAAIINDSITDSIINTVKSDSRFDLGVFTLQKEVAQRMCAKPSTQNYSSFTVLCNWAYTVTPIMDLSGGSFYPVPNVDSRAVKLVKNDDFPRCKNPAFFMKLLRACFANRRKTIKNNLSAFLGNIYQAENILLSAGINPQTRAEALALETFLHLSDYIEESP